MYSLACTVGRIYFNLLFYFHFIHACLMCSQIQCVEKFGESLTFRGILFQGIFRFKIPILCMYWHYSALSIHMKILLSILSIEYTTFTKEKS